MLIIFSHSARIITLRIHLKKARDLPFSFPLASYVGLADQIQQLHFIRIFRIIRSSLALCVCVSVCLSVRLSVGFVYVCLCLG